MRSRLGWAVGTVIAALAIGVVTAAVAQDTKADAGAPSSQRALRAGDELDVVVTFRAKVAADGSISLPTLGRIDAGGLSVEEVRAAAAKLVAPSGASCELRMHPARSVSVIGAVHATVELPADRDLRMVELLARVKGLNGSGADLSQVRVRRLGADGRPFTFDVSVDDTVRGGTQQDVFVRADDIVIVLKQQDRQAASAASAGQVYVAGAVRKAGRWPIVSGRRPFTLVKLIALFGEFTEKADRGHIRVIRIGDTGREVIDVDLDAVMEGKAPDVELRPEDLVFVPERI